MTTPVPDWQTRIAAALTEHMIGGETDNGGVVWYADDPAEMAVSVMKALGLDHWSETQSLLTVQGMPGNWDYDPYMHGMYNGMELILAVVEGRETAFRSAPGVWRHTVATDIAGLPGDERG